MNGWLICNGSLQSKKFHDMNEFIIKSAVRKNISLTLLTNEEVLMMCDGDNRIVVDHARKPDFVLFLDKDVTLARTMELSGLRVFNRASSIALCDDKIKTYQQLSRYHLPIPTTIFAPLLFVYHDNRAFLAKVEQQLSYPMIIKEAFGSFGEQVYFIENRQQLIDKYCEIWNKPHCYQQFIESSKGRDVRIYVVKDKVVAAMERNNDHDFRANITLGGTMKKIELSDDWKQCAINASKALNLDFCGVDILYGDDGKPILCEVNSNAHFINCYKCTGVNVADYIFDHIIEEIYG